MKRQLVIIVALSCAVAACKKKDEPAAAKDEPRKEERKPVVDDDDDDEPEAKAPEAKAPEAPKPSSAEGGALAPKSESTDCPKSLEGTDEADRTIKSECGTIAVTGEYNVSGGTLTIEAGVTLAFGPGGGLNVGYGKPSKLIVKGTAEKPVKFTTSGDKVPGAWKSVHLYDGASRSSLEGLVIEYGGGDDDGSLYVDRAEDVVIKGCTIQHSKESGVRTDDKGTFKEFTGNTFADIGKAAMRLSPRSAGLLGDGNTFPKDAVIHVSGGKISTNTTWRNAGVPFVLLADVSIDGGEGTRADLTIEAGATIKMDSDAKIYAGYSQQGGLMVKGTTDQPVTFTGLTAQEPGAWGGVKIYQKGEATIEGAIFEHGGSDEDDGVLQATRDAQIVVKGSTFRKNKRAIHFEKGTRLKAFEGNAFQETGVAVRTTAQVLAGLGAGNSYDAGAKILLDGGTVDKTATWRAQATVIEVAADVSVDDEAVLTVEAGTKLVFKEGIGLSVGYSKPSGLKMLGTAEKPIEVRGVRDEAGVWRNLHFYPHARGNELAYVQLHGAGGEGAVEVDGVADLTTDHVSCAKCASATIRWECRSKVTNTEPAATDGTPAAEAKPEGCE